MNSKTVLPAYVERYLQYIFFMITVAEQDAGADPIDQVYQPIASLEALPWFGNTNDEPAAEVENAATIARVKTNADIQWHLKAEVTQNFLKS